MATTTTCLSTPILHAVAAGQVAEPLLSVYLEHLAACDICCSRIESQADRRVEPPTARRYQHAVAGFPVPQDARANAGLDDWLATLKRVTAVDTGRPESLIGTPIGRFRIVGVLGTGASSIVYEAIDEDLDRPVVLKVLRTHLEDDELHRQLVVSEARALATLRHESIMPLLQLTWHDGSPVLVFPRLAGTTLAEALATGQCKPRMILTVVRDVARALAHAHTLGIFHYDIKPSNIWVHEESVDHPPRGLLFDFGLTAAADARGTPGYSEPGASATADPQSRDAFSLGVVLHECLTHADGLPARFRDMAHRLTQAEPAARPRPSRVATDITQLLSPTTGTWRALPLVLLLAGAIVLAAGLGSTAGARRTKSATNAAVAGPIEPDLIVPPRGLPVTVSGDARVLSFVSEGSHLHVRRFDSQTDLLAMPIDFSPQRLAFNADATRVGVADESGHVAIVQVDTSEITYRHFFEGGIQWMGWAGWQRDALVVLSNGAVYAFFKTVAPPDGSRPIAPWSMRKVRSDVRSIATLPGVEAVVSLDVDGAVTMWSIGWLTEDLVLEPGPVLSAPLSLGWKREGVVFMAHGRSILERVTYEGKKAYEALVPIKSIVWPTETQYVALSDEPHGPNRLVWGDSSRPEWSRDFDLGGERAEDVLLLPDHDRIVVITTKGEIRLYSRR